MNVVARDLVRDLFSDAARDGARDLVSDGVRDGARDVVNDGARDGLQDGVRDGAQSATGSELQTAARDVVHDSTDAGVRESAKTARQGIKSTPGIILASTTGASTLAGTGFALWKANQTVDNAGKGIRDLGNGIKDLITPVAHTLDDLGKHVPGSIQNKVDQAIHGAHDLGQGLIAPAQTGLTILVVLLGVVGAYEAYRFLR